jgi:hypothetical protein
MGSLAGVGIGSLTGIGHTQGAGYGAPPFRSAPLASVKIQAVSAADPTTSAITKRIFTHHLSALRACYERALRADPSLKGALTLDLTIDEDGAVKRATIKKSFSLEVGTCAQGVALPLTFPRPKGGAAEVTVELRFSSP